MPFPSHIFLRTRSLAKSITTLCITAQRTHPQIFFSPPPRFPPLRPEVLSPDRLKICTNCKPPLASRTGIKRTPRGYLLDGHWRSFASTRHYLKSSYRRILSHTILHRRRFSNYNHLDPGCALRSTPETNLETCSKISTPP